MFDYFGGLIPPPFTLRDAINSGVLTRYFYHPEKIYLTNSEQEDWNSITKEIQILVARISTGESNTIDINGNPKLKQLLIISTGRQMDYLLRQHYPIASSVE